MARVRKGRKPAPENPSNIDAEVLYRAGLYGRLSDLNNGKADGDPLESQVDIMERYVAERPYLHYEKLYLDNGFTGTNFERPAWEELLADVRVGKINCIIVKDLSRLGRNYLEVGSFLEKDCPLLGIRFISINDGYDSATLNSTEELAAALKNIINDYYAKDISRKVGSALASKRKKGDYIGSYAPYGYLKDPENKNRLIIDPETAPIVRQIYMWRAEGDGYGTILRRLNEHDIPCPGRYRFEHGIITNNNKKGSALLWNRHAVSDILRNIVYIGHLAQGKCRACLHQGIPAHTTSPEEWDIVYHTHEPILDEALFYAVQEVNERQSAAYKSNYGKYENLPKERNPYRKKLVCADCGTQLKLYRNLYRGGEKSCYTYICPTYEEHRELRCAAKKSVRSNKLDAAVLAAIQTQMELFADAGTILADLLTRRPQRPQKAGVVSKLQTLRQQLAHKTAYSTSLYTDWKEGILTFDEYNFAKEKYRTEIEMLKQQISEIEQSDFHEQDRIPRAEAWKQKIALYRNVKKVTPELVDALIEEIRLAADGSITVVFRFEDEYQQILKEIEQLKAEEVA